MIAASEAVFRFPSDENQASRPYDDSLPVTTYRCLAAARLVSYNPRKQMITACDTCIPRPPASSSNLNIIRETEGLINPRFRRGAVLSFQELIEDRKVQVYQAG